MISKANNRQLVRGPRDRCELALGSPFGNGSTRFKPHDSISPTQPPKFKFLRFAHQSSSSGCPTLLAFRKRVGILTSQISKPIVTGSKKLTPPPPGAPPPAPAAASSPAEATANLPASPAGESPCTRAQRHRTPHPSTLE